MSDDTATVKIEVEQSELDRLRDNVQAGRLGYEAVAVGRLPVEEVSVSTPGESPEPASRRGITDEQALEFLLWTVCKNRLERISSSGR